MERLHGRADVLERARNGLDNAWAGHGRLLLLSGEPGIGKSRLAEHVAAEAGARGAAVAWGRCWEAGGAPAYWPWIQVFRALGMDDDPFVGAARSLGAADVEARFAAFDRAVRALKTAAVQRPLVLVLDDLHAADAPSLLLLLARELRSVPLLVVGAYRDAETRAHPELATLLAKIAREAEVLPLARLSAEDVGAWLRELDASADAARAETLHRISEGHPLFLVEALRLGLGGDAARAWPAGPGVLDERLGAVAIETRALLRVAAVLGRDFRADELAALAGSAHDAPFEALKEALAASIVVPGAEADEFRFSHVLLRDRLYDELAPSARAELHWRAGTQALARGGAAEAAIHHLFAGEDHGDLATVAAVALTAAEAELSRLAFEDAARIGARALDLCAQRASAQQPATEVAVALRLVCAEARMRQGDGALAQRSCVEAADMAERANLGELLARAALVYGTELASGMVDAQMISLLRRALARLDESPSPLRARVMARLAAALTPTDDPARAREVVALMRSASDMARALGDRQALSFVLSFGATVALLIPEAERFSIMTETVELARALDQRLTLASALPAYITTLLGRGERARAEAEFARYDELLAGFPQPLAPLHRLRRLLLAALLSALAGELDAAERASEAARVVASAAPSGSLSMLWLTQRLALAQLYARPELVAPEAPRLLAHFATMPQAIPYSSWLLCVLGRRAEATESLRQTSLEPHAIPSADLIRLMGAAETSVWLGERAIGERLYPLLARSSDRMLSNLGPGALLGPSARVLGDLAASIGRAADALRHYDEGIAFGEKLGSPPLIELCRRARERVLAGGLAAGESAPPARLPPAIPRPTLRREGELWVISGTSGPPLRLRASKGLEYLERLMQQPGRALHVIELAGVEHRTGDGGAVLDRRAKAEYQERLEDLGSALREAESLGDGTRAERVQSEIDALTEQLAAAVGLGGRDRRAASDVERMRVNVQRRLKDALDRIAAGDPALGRYLAAAVKTGTYCVYDPL